MVVGKRLAERWELPPLLREAIWLHGQAPQALPQGIKSPRLVNLITLADLIAHERHLGYSGNYVLDQPRDGLAASVGLTWQTIENKLAPLLERIEHHAVLNLNVPSTHELYQQAMKRANQELGKVSTQLAMKNRPALASRSRFFDALNAFQNQLRPDANPQAVLRVIGQTAAGLLEAGALWRFSV